jgi:lysophospholipase L1-like esterase
MKQRMLALFLLALSACACASPTARATAGAAPVSASASGFGKAPRVLALGDSFTIGTGSGEQASYPARLCARWPGPEKGKLVLRNLAVNGYTTQDLLDEELPQVRDFSPDLVFLAIGANDLVRGSDEAEYRSQVRRILTALRGLSVPPAALVALPQPDWSLSPAASSFGDPAAIAAIIERFNAILREEVTAVGGRYADLFPLMRRQARAGMVAGDGLHPSAAAYDEWAQELLRLGGPTRSH